MEHLTTESTAAAVRAELARRKIKRSTLAEGLGWSRTTTWRRLNGEQALTVDDIGAIAAFLGVPVSTFLPDRTAA